MDSQITENRPRGRPRGSKDKKPRKTRKSRRLTPKKYTIEDAELDRLAEVEVLQRQIENPVLPDRRSKYAVHADSLALPGVRNEETADKIQDIVAYKYRGMTYDLIAKKMSIDPSYITQLKRRYPQAFEHARIQFRQRVIDDVEMFRVSFLAELSESCMDALATLKDLSKNAKAETVRRSASIDILNLFAAQPAIDGTRGGGRDTIKRQAVVNVNNLIMNSDPTQKEDAYIKTIEVQNNEGDD